MEAAGHQLDVTHTLVTTAARAATSDEADAHARPAADRSSMKTAAFADVSTGRRADVDHNRIRGMQRALG